MGLGDRENEHSVWKIVFYIKNLNCSYLSTFLCLHRWNIYFTYILRLSEGHAYKNYHYSFVFISLPIERNESTDQKEQFNNAW